MALYKLSVDLKKSRPKEFTAENNEEVSLDGRGHEKENYNGTKKNGTIRAQEYAVNHRRLLDVAWKVYDITTEMAELGKNVDDLNKRVLKCCQGEVESKKDRNDVEESDSEVLLPEKVPEEDKAAAAESAEEEHEKDSDHDTPLDKSYLEPSAKPNGHQTTQVDDDFDNFLRRKLDDLYEEEDASKENLVPPSRDSFRYRKGNKDADSFVRTYAPFTASNSYNTQREHLPSWNPETDLRDFMPRNNRSYYDYIRGKYSHLLGTRSLFGHTGNAYDDPYEIPTKYLGSDTFSNDQFQLDMKPSDLHKEPLRHRLRFPDYPDTTYGFRSPQNHTEPGWSRHNFTRKEVPILSFKSESKPYSSVSFEDVLGKTSQVSASSFMEPYARKILELPRVPNLGSNSGIYADSPMSSRYFGSLRRGILRQKEFENSLPLSSHEKANYELPYSRKLNRPPSSLDLDPSRSYVYRTDIHDLVFLPHRHEDGVVTDL